MNVGKELLIFCSGAACGAVLGLKLIDMKYQKSYEEEVNKRIDSIMDEKRAEEKERKRERQETDLHTKVQYNQIVRKEYDDNGKEETMAENYEHPMDDDEEPVADSPYVIDEDEFDAKNGYDKESLYYYLGNHLLVNDQDEVVEPADAEIMLGHGWDNTDLQVTYIRNEKIRTDYELVINQGIYEA